MSKTHYATVKDFHVRYWYDRSLKLWAIYEVSKPNEDGYQIGAAEYEMSREYLLQLAEYIIQSNHGPSRIGLTA
jgi:hypothetical protein